ncbi:LD-carboxypeptidase [Glycomyces sp. L485]|uniref:S66 peptidase family protein n=1 Tax=Glycomyces sp. L485 TaxID=2909235 RepID=UPI001F4B57E2|nr:S66 peptidase family protein [Glycomyces sp. L485]MCH7229568.1 LD-carboxypeptidase [Glycomyces sp. L485]
MQPLRPRRLHPGDTVVIAAPSGPFLPGRRDELDSGIAAIEDMGFDVRVSKLVESASRRFWRSAPPAEQSAEINELLADPDVRAIVPFAGGNATTGYIDRLDYDAVRADPKPLLGFSDITALHLALHSQTGLIGMHADFAPGLGNFWEEASTPERRGRVREILRGLLTGEITEIDLPADEQWETWKPGRATGRLVGGLLDRLVRLQATPYALPPEAFDGAILFWEDVGRNIGHIWNDLHSLRLQGVFDRVGAMVVGIPTDLHGPPEKYGPATVSEVVLDVLADHDLPILGGVEFGHTGPNLPMPIGLNAEVDADSQILKLLESPVS